MPVLDSFVRKYVEALHEENAAVFAGAGLSIPAGMVDWKELLRNIADDVGLDVDREQDLISVAQFHVNEHRGRHQINQALVTEFAQRAELTENHRLLASLPIRTYWTTNYDSLIEESLRAAHKRPDVKSDVRNLAVTVPRRDATVYKMHGDVAHPDQAVIARDDYEAYEDTHRLFSIALQGDLVSKTFLFIGFSFSDPNLAYVLARIRRLLGENRREHYCLLRRVARSDFSSHADYEYARARQDLQVRDLRRYGIIGVMVADFAEYTDALRRVVAAFRRGTVFVSGSAATFDPWPTSEAESLIRTVGRLLIERGFDVVTGVGRGVGSPLLNGVLDGLGAQGSYVLHDRVILRPFPQGLASPQERAARFSAYRREMVAHSGVALFLFGNRTGPDGRPELAKGVEEEFESSVEAGIAVVPVGATGYVAARLHQRVLHDFDRFFPNGAPLKDDFAALANVESSESLANRIVRFLVSLRDS